MATASNVIMELGSEDVATGFKEFSVLSLRETLEEIRYEGVWVKPRWVWVWRTPQGYSVESR